MRGELGEVVRRRMWVDDAAPGQAREADVRQRRERLPVPTHLLQGGERGHEAGSMVRAHHRDVEVVQTLRGLGRGHPRERLGCLVEGHERDNRQARDAPHGEHRVLELLEVVKRLDREHVDTPAFEYQGLLGEQVRSDAARRALAERADRSGDEHVATRDLSCFSGEPDRGRVDRLELVLQVVRRQLPAIGSERVRLDELGACVDEAEVERHDCLRSAHIRLLGASQTRHGCADERAHTPVGDDGRAGGQALEEAAHARHSTTSRSGRPRRRGQPSPSTPSG